MGMIITMPRGDLRPVQFTITDLDGQELEEDLDLTSIFFTVKRTARDARVLFQRGRVLYKETEESEPVDVYTGVSIEKVDKNTYRFVIEPEDTEKLAYGDYVFDIELIRYVDQSDPSSEDLKQTNTGILRITEEVTFRQDETAPGLPK